MAGKPLNMRGKLQSIIQNKVINTEEAKLRYYTNMFRYSPKKKAIQIDGAFFETYNLIKGKQKKRLDDARRSSLQRQKKLRQVSADSNEFSYTLDEELRLDLYKELMFTVRNRIGANNSGLNTDELVSYTQKIFNVSVEEHGKILEDMSAQKPPKIVINIKILEGTELRSKDANGFSDPYCMLCLVKKGETLIQGKNKRNALKEYQHNHNVQFTRVIEGSTSPAWNEEFSFELDDINEQVLHIDVWDKDDEDVVLDNDNKIKFILGFGHPRRFLTDVYQAHSGKERDDFLGLIEIPLNTISEGGTDEWYQLESRKVSKKVKYGQLRLDISFAFRDPISTCNPILSPVNVYEHLLYCFANESISNHLAAENDRTWNCTFQHQANTLLHQYQLFHSLTPLSALVIKLMVCSNLFANGVVSPIFLFQLLVEYSQLSEENEVENKEEDSAGFLVSLEQLKNCLQEKIKKHKFLYCYDNTEQFLELENVLKCLKHIYELPIFQGNFDIELCTELDALLIGTTTMRFEQICAPFNLNGDDITENIANAVDFVNTANAELKADYQHYQPLFQSISYYDYYKQSFNTMEQLLCPIIIDLVKELQVKLRKAVFENDSIAETYTTKMFELYTSIKTTSKLKRKLVENEQNKGLLSSYSDWFREAVADWMNVAFIKAKARLTRSVELDELVVIDEMVKHSTSALDVTWCLRQICTFWTELDWGNPTDLYVFLVRITDILSECCIVYSDIILKKLFTYKIVDENKEFFITDNLCIMMNDLGHVMEFLKKISDYLPYGDTIKRLGELYDGEMIPRFERTFKELLDCAHDEMDNKITKIMTYISLQLKGSLFPLIGRVIKANGSTYEKELEILMTYIDKNLITLNSTLIVHVFVKALNHLWKEFLTMITEILDFEKQNLVASQYKNCGNMIDAMKYFFYGNGHGLTEEQLNSSNLHDLQCTLNLYKTSTEELIEQFITLCCNYSQQSDQTENMGSLTFKAYYSEIDSILNVQIMNCRDLRPLDLTGSIDPYISLSLVPNHQYPTQEKRRTRHKEKDFFPIYDELFQFKTQLKPSLALMFNLYDKDLFTRDDLYGEIFYSLENVPIVNKDTHVASFDACEQVELSWGIVPMKGKLLETIKERSGYNQIALDFFKLRRIAYKRMKGNWKRSAKIQNSKKENRYYLRSKK